jgi:hypothetical protein
MKIAPDIDGTADRRLDPSSLDEPIPSIEAGAWEPVE